MSTPARSGSVQCRFNVFCVAQEIQKCAANTCEALCILHQAGLVHRDIRKDNLVQIGDTDYMLIDLETVADSDAAALPEYFAVFRDWDNRTLEGHRYCLLAKVVDAVLAVRCRTLRTCIFRPPHHPSEVESSAEILCLCGFAAPMFCT
jgi:serine/threonine protein kinase